MKILKIVVGIIIFPIGIYWIAHSWGTLKLMPVARPKIKAHIELNVRNLNDTFSSSAVHYNKIKRLAVAANGHRIDTYVVSPDESTLRNRRWILVAGGNTNGAEEYALAACCEQDNFLSNVSRELNANLLFFNCAGVLGSEGRISMNSMAKSYRAMLKLLTDQESGIQAEVGILINKSMGGGVSAAGRSALGCPNEKHVYQFPSNITFLVINDATYASLPKIVNTVAGAHMELFARFLGWNVDVAAQSKELAAQGIPEIIIHPEEGDRVIPWKASLANAMTEHASNHKVIVPLHPQLHLEPKGTPHMAPPNKKVQSLLTNLARVYLGDIEASISHCVNHLFEKMPKHHEA